MVVALCLTVVAVVLIIFAPEILEGVSVLLKIVTTVSALGLANTTIKNIPGILNGAANFVLACKS